MLVSKEQIQALLPQHPPMVMVDELLQTAETSTRCGFTILPENIFVEHGLFTEPGLVENIAQTAAAGVGYIAQQNNQPAPIGFIGAIKDLEVFFLPGTGYRIETEVQVINQIFDVSLVKGTVYHESEIVASCEMKIFISKQ